MRFEFFVRFIFGALLCLQGFNLSAHEARPIVVDVVESSPLIYELSLTVPSTFPEAGIPQLAMPTICSLRGDVGFLRESTRYLLTGQYQCQHSIQGQVMRVVYPADKSNTNALFRLSLLNGESFSQLLSPNEREWQIPEQEQFFHVALQYTGLGFEHIFAGVDHLLFVACLLFIAGTFRRIVVTITGFTLAHSLTLFLSVLGVVNVPVPPVEAIIALSILFLAHEIVVQNSHSWTWRFPILVSSSFGLLHGFGFAAVLQDIGLPQTELVAALLFFNVGVELGQLVFIALLSLGFMWAQYLCKKYAVNSNLHSQGVSSVGAYSIGTLAAYWFIIRVAQF